MEFLWKSVPSIPKVTASHGLWNGAGAFSHPLQSVLRVPAHCVSSDPLSTRHQKRQVEEKGPFGKSFRRKGTAARTTRTQTPARKENPTLDGFEAALKFDAQRESPDTQRPSVKPPVAHAAQSLQSSQTVAAEPTAVKLFGYSPETQYAAIEYYERVSGGMVCEDYERRPVPRTGRFGLGGTLTGSLPRRRPLTTAEQRAASVYVGGRCWIRVTFDSRAAADRAMATSPHILHGHWVFAQLYHGQGPAHDEPVPQINGSLEPPDISEGSHSHAAPTAVQDPGPRLGMSSGFGVPSPSTSTSDTLQSSSTLNPDRDSQRSPPPEPAAVATSISPAPSGGVVPAGGAVAPPAQVRQRNFSHFPDTPATQLHDASEALLPSPSWTDWILSTLGQSGFFPGDVLGSTVPRKEDGDFDWDASSFYWRICYWLDTNLGTDLCGLKDN